MCFNTQNSKSANGIIRCKELLNVLQISRSTLFRWERNQPDFPRRRRLGERSVGWLRAEVYEWLDSRERVDQASDKGGGHE